MNRLNSLSVLRSGVLIESEIVFEDLAERREIVNPDRDLRIRMGRLTRAAKPIHSKYSYFDDLATINLTTSDRRVADLLGIDCWPREHIAKLAAETCYGTNTLLECVDVRGKVRLWPHLCNDGYESAMMAGMDDEIPFHEPHEEVALAGPCCFVSIVTAPGLYVDYTDTAKEMAQALQFFLNDAYVYQVIDRSGASVWKVGTLDVVRSLVKKDLRERFFPHLMQACRSFMTEGLVPA